jgi:hypothetical protein
MIRRLILIGLLCLLILQPLSTFAERKPDIAKQVESLKIYGRLPLSFIENQGQVSEPVRYYVKAPGGTVYFTPDEVVMDFVKKNPVNSPDTDEDKKEVSVKKLVVRKKFIGRNKNVEIKGQNELPGKVNIFKGKDPSQWKRRIPTFKQIIYRELYPGIDLIYSGEEGELNYQLLVKPKARVRSIRFQYQGIKKIKLDKSGSLIVETAWGEVTEPRPYVYQQEGNKTVKVAGRYQIFKNNKVRFEVGKYNKSIPLMISIFIK